MVADSARSFSHLANLKVTGELRVTGTTTFTGAVTMTSALAKANLNANVSRKTVTININGGAQLANGTTYRQWAGMGGRAATVTKITTNCRTAIVGGTNTLKVLAGGASGTTLLSTASVDPTSASVFTADTISSLSLAASPVLTAAQDVTVELVTGTQGTPGVGYSVTIEYVLDDA